MADGRNHLTCLSEKLMDANEPNADLAFAPECGIHRAHLLQFNAFDKPNLSVPRRALCPDVCRQSLWEMMDVTKFGAADADAAHPGPHVNISGHRKQN